MSHEYSDRATLPSKEVVFLLALPETYKEKGDGSDFRGGFRYLRVGNWASRDMASILLSSLSVILSVIFSRKVDCAL